MSNYSEPHTLIAARQKLLFHVESLVKLDDPAFIHINLVVNGLLSALISGLVSVFFFEEGSYEQRGRTIFILVCILLGMFALSPIRRGWTMWRITQLKTKVNQLQLESCDEQKAKKIKRSQKEQPENWFTIALKREIEDANQD